jgi:hypothetical protein
MMCEPCSVGCPWNFGSGYERFISMTEAVVDAAPDM